MSPSWDSILDRLAKLERSHADLARFVASIHEALPPEIAAATGRTLALGSPIDSVAPPAHAPTAPPPILGTPPPLPPRVEPPGAVGGVDSFTQTYEAPDPWATAAAPGDFFQPAVAVDPFPQSAVPERKRFFRGRKAAKQAQARIAAEFAAAATASHLVGGSPEPMTPPPPPPGFGFDAGAVPSFGLSPETPPYAPPLHATAPQPDAGPGFPDQGLAPPPGFFGSASAQAAAPPPPVGFAFDMAEPKETQASDADDFMAPTSWGAVDLTSPADLEFDAPAHPAGFGSEHNGLSLVPPPPPPGFGADVPPPPPGFGAGLEEGMVPPPPPGFGADVPPPPPGFGAGLEEGMVPPPPGYGQVAQGPSDHVFGDLQEINSLITPEQLNAQDESGVLAGSGDRTSYSAVPPITPDFFARSAGRGRR